MTNTMKKRIVLLTTGGTITAGGADGETIGYRYGVIRVGSLIRNIPHIEEIADIECESLFDISSADFSRRRWLTLVRRVNEYARDPEIDGIVITHGTDTLDETAYFLTLGVHSDKPVVLTGAMRPATAISADGSMNLYQAVQVAASDQARGMGALVVFSDAIYSGRDVQKVSTFRVEGFNSPDFGPIGYIRNDQVVFFGRSLRRHTIHSEFDFDELGQLPKVEIAYFHVDAEPGIIRFLGEHADGLILAGCGSGTFSDEWADELETVVRRIPVIRASRVGRGLIIEDPTIDGRVHTLCSELLAPQKLKVLLMAALTKTNDLDELRRIIAEY